MTRRIVKKGIKFKGKEYRVSITEDRKAHWGGIIIKIYKEKSIFPVYKSKTERAIDSIDHIQVIKEVFSEYEIELKKQKEVSKTLQKLDEWNGVID